MKIYNCIQGTTEWLNLRKGIPTASSFHHIVTPKGNYTSAGQYKYMCALIAERLLERPLTEHVSFYMERGSQMEEDAVEFYQLARDCDTVPIGFVTNDDGTVGASPDRFVGDEGSLEIKCPKETVHVSYLLQEGGAYSEYKIQAQGQLWVSERKWVDVLSYHPELPEALVRIERDDKFIEILAHEVTQFVKMVDTNWILLQERLAIHGTSVV